MREPVCVILAGGLSRRMGGGDKALRPLGEVSMLAHVIERIAPQVADLVLNANGDPARFSETGLDVVADPIEGFAGPLAGVLAGMGYWRSKSPDARWMLSVPSDAPFLPDDLALRLLKAAEAEDAALAVATSGGREHPVVGLWSLALYDDLKAAVIAEEVRKVDVWTARHKLARVAFDLLVTPQGPLDHFFNANRPEDMLHAESYLKSLRSHDKRG